MARKTRGLGKGLKALIPDEIKNFEEEIEQSVTKGTVEELPINQIRPNQDQPRKHFDPVKLQELAESIKAYGIIQPLIVQPQGDNGYTIIAGERRFRAANLANLKKVPVIIKDLSALEVIKLALIENVQREDLNIIEEAQAYQLLYQQFELTQQDIAESMGKSRSSIVNIMRLLKLPEAVQALVVSGELSFGHAKVLLGLKEPERMQQVCDYVLEKQLTVRETEAYIKKMQQKKPTKTQVQDQYINAVQENLKQQYNRKVHILEKNYKGKITLPFYNKEDLNCLLEQLGLSEERSDFE